MVQMFKGGVLLTNVAAVVNGGAAGAGASSDTLPARLDWWSATRGCEFGVADVLGACADVLGACADVPGACADVPGACKGM